MRELGEALVDGFRSAVRDYFKPLKTRWFWYCVIVGTMILAILDKH